MSTILKALRRLEEQKKNHPERALRDEVVLAPSRRAQRPAWTRAIIAGATLGVAGIGLLLALRTVREPEPPAASALPPLREVAAPPPAETATAVSVPPVAPPPAVVPVPPEPKDFEVVRPDASARPLAPLPLPTIGEDEAVAEPPRSRQRASAAPDPGEYVEEPLEEAPAPRVVAKAATPVRVARTLWHPSPDRRLAWVEVEGQTALREVREGERVGPYLVREIEPTAVLFADGNVEIRREVGP